MTTTEYFEYLERLRADAESAGVPAHLIDGALLYIGSGHAPGSFLTAVLRNDLWESVARADGRSREGLVELVLFLYNSAPAPCWGTAERVTSWTADGGLYGRCVALD